MGSHVHAAMIVRSYEWPCCRRISLDVFTHTLDLDLNFHLHRKTGEVMRIMDRGSSLQSVLHEPVIPYMLTLARQMLTSSRLKRSQLHGQI